MVFPGNPVDLAIINALPMMLILALHSTCTVLQWCRYQCSQITPAKQLVHVLPTWLCRIGLGLEDTANAGA